MTNEMTVRASWPQTMLRFLAALALYFLAGRIGLAVPFTSANVSPVWPASGIALAAALVWGWPALAAVAVGAFLVNFSTGIPPLSAGFVALGNCGSALLGMLLLRRLLKIQIPLLQLKDTIGLISLGALLSPVVAASVGTATLTVAHLHPWEGFTSSWKVWWSGDAMGVLIITPLILAMWPPRYQATPKRRFELFILASGALLLCFAIFGGHAGLFVRDDVLVFLLFPFVIWAAIRFHTTGASAITLLIAVSAVWGTAHGLGPFVGHTPLHNAVLLELFLGVTAATGLILAAVMSEREHIGEALVINQRLLQELRETERSLLENQTRLELAQQAARMGVWEWDTKANEVIWSMGAPALYGVTESTFRISYDEWLSFVHPDDRELVCSSVEDALAGRKEHDLEFRTVTRDGKVRWLAGRGKVFRDSTGKPGRMTGICIDITDLKQTQQALQEAHNSLEVRVKERTQELDESNRALRGEIKERVQAQEAIEFQTRRLREQSHLLDLANDAILIRTLDGSISYWNEGAERLYGWSKAEALGQAMNELLSTEFPGTIEEIKQTLMTTGCWEGELLHVMRDGSRLTVASRWTLWRDQDGAARGWLQIDSNISQQKDAELALRDLSGRLLHLQDEERRRLARELHDSTGQALAALQMNLEVLRQRTISNDVKAQQAMKQTSDLAAQVVREIRTMSYLLH
ncbi:MAG TPA: MASE1 domain-containing protein, partial [Terriglobales bacterium]